MANGTLQKQRYGGYTQNVGHSIFQEKGVILKKTIGNIFFKDILFKYIYNYG